MQYYVCLSFVFLNDGTQKKKKDDFFGYKYGVHLLIYRKNIMIEFEIFEIAIWKNKFYGYHFCLKIKVKFDSIILSR